MNIQIIKTDSSFALPNELMGRIKGTTEYELKVLVAIAFLASEGKNDVTEEEIASLSGVDGQKIRDAIQFWRGAGLITLDSTGESTQKQEKLTLQKDDIPHYSGQEIADLYEKNKEIPMLVEECQRIAGKIFNPHEINKIVSLYDYLGLSASYILTVFAYCAKKGKTTVHYIEKTAFNLYNEGVDTDEALEEYMQNKQRYDGVEGIIRRLFGLGKRALGAKENAIVKNLADVWKFSEDIIEHAYEATVNGTSAPSIPYMGKILENWHNAGYTTLDEIKNGEFEYRKAKNTQNVPQDNNNNNSDSFDTDDFFEAALRRSYENLGKNPDEK
ncbi:MAG: DnaD domain protein [Clostridia bacterium]|nr:DnaD domain protein [Clostridia bacterium]